MLEKDAEWIKPGVVYSSHRPQLPDDGMKVTLHIVDGREIACTFKRDGYDFLEEGTGNRWNLANPGVKGWSIPE